MRPIDSELKKQVIHMSRHGMGRNQIARDLGLSRSSVTNILCTAGISKTLTPKADQTQTSPIETKAVSFKETPKPKSKHSHEDPYSHSHSKASVEEALPVDVGES